ncbi:alpha-L-rhamnosidase C-terminal domain-containing protein, partial [Streptomyces flaveolus]|uniref:alpha-L-rhamnosidase C-terminal domain-containing protein n=1 Tax=Streptomyces flaveolus TaxID=67297 RepID=UPI00343F8286
MATWFYQRLAGIRPISTAYESLRIRPYIPRAPVNSRVLKDVKDTDLSPVTLDHVSASINTVRGRVSSEWRRCQDGRIDLAVTVPYNTEAEVWVPTQGCPLQLPGVSPTCGTRPSAARPTRSTAPVQGRTDSTPGELTGGPQHRGVPGPLP